MIRLNYNIITNAVRGPTHQRERKEGRNKGEQQRGKGKDEGLDRQREEVTVVYILKAEGKLLNYRWVRLICERQRRRGEKERKRWKEGQRRRGEARVVGSKQLKDCLLWAKHVQYAHTNTHMRARERRHRQLTSNRSEAQALCAFYSFYSFFSHTDTHT